MNEMYRRSFVQALKDTIPVMGGYVVLAIGFGLVCRESGLPGWAAVAMSVFIYGGSMQFVNVALIASGASFVTAALTAFMVQARHLFYGISMIGRYRDAGIRKPLMIFTLTDETYSLVCTDDLPEGCDPVRYRFWVGMLDYAWWVGGTVLGVLLGQLIPFSTAGIEFSMTALFVTVFVEQWLSADTHIPALTGLCASVLALFVFGPGSFLIPSMIMITVLLGGLRRRIEPEEGR